MIIYVCDYIYIYIYIYVYVYIYIYIYIYMYYSVRNNSVRTKNHSTMNKKSFNYEFNW